VYKNITCYRFKQLRSINTNVA